jgi:GNAT superfamily N-acetyltransferase
VWIEHLTAAHDLAGFTCGKKPLDDWLRHHALENDRRGLSKVWVLVEAGVVLGYYSLSTTTVRHAELPPKLGRGLPGVELPGVLLGRLAVAHDVQHEGLGTELLLSALQKVFQATELVAARFIAVDPLDEEAREWYTRRGFRAVQGDAGGRMFVRIDDAQASFERAWR